MNAPYFLTYAVLCIKEGGKADNRAKYKVVGFGVIGKGFWSFLAAKRTKSTVRNGAIATYLSKYIDEKEI